MSDLPLRKADTPISLRLEEQEYGLIVIFLTLLLFPLLSIVRFLDDNTLSSWRWVFMEPRIMKLSLYIAACTCLAFAFSRVGIPEKLYGPLCITGPLFVAFFLRNSPELFLDTSRYVVQAKAAELHGTGYFLREWGQAIPAWTDMPLVPLLYGLLFRFLGESRTVIQGFNALMFSCTALATYGTGKELWNRRAGFHASLLLLTVPYLLIQLPFMMVDITTMFFLTLSCYLAIRAVKYGGLFNLISASFVLVLTLFTKYSTWLMLPGLLVVPFSQKDMERRKAWKRALFVALPACAVFLSVLCLKYHVIIEQTALLRSYQLPALRRWHESLFSTFLFQSHPFLLLSAMIGAWHALRKKERSFLVPLWFFAFLLLSQVQRMRYLLPLFPLFILMASYGLQRLRSPAVGRFIVYSMIGFALTIVFGGFLPFSQSTGMANLKDAGEFLDSLDRETVRVVTLPQARSSGSTSAVVPVLDLYTRKGITYAGPQTGPPGGLDISSSPLRFTWEFGTGDLYAGESPGTSIPVVLISGTPLRQGTSHPSLRWMTSPVRTFEKTSRAFRYHSYVYVYFQ